MREISEYFVGVVSELRLVTWPKKETVIKLTVIVLLSSLIVGSFVGIADLGYTKLLSLIIK
ncbi:MAG: preprotein translocase subunit SecE [Patescibacteria group bacterium]